MLVDRTGIEPAVPVGNTISGPLMVDQLGIEPRSLQDDPYCYQAIVGLSSLFGASGRTRTGKPNGVGF